MKSQSLLASITIFFLVVAAPLLRAQHSHLNAGVYDTNNNGIVDAGDELGFKNADDWVYNFVTNSGYVHQATTTTVGNIATYYGGTAYTFGMTPTALSGNSGRRATIGTGGAVTYAPWEPFSATSNGNLAVGGAASGSFLQLEVVSVELLSGSATSFSFWGPTSAYPSPAGTTPTFEWTFSGPGVGTLLTSDAKIDLSAINTRIGNGVDTTFPGTAPTYPNAHDALQTGEGYRWNVDYNGGLYNLANAVDPYGHIHGRSWAADGEGEFKITFRAVDANGVHTESELLTVNWSSIPEPSTWLLFAAGGLLLVLKRHRRSVQL